MSFSFSNKDFYSIKYYGNGDLAGGIFIKNAVDNLEELEMNISKINVSIDNQEEFYINLWLLSYRTMIEEIDKYKIEEDVKSKLIAFYNKVDYSPKRLIKYINRNYELIFDKKSNEEMRWYEYFEIVLLIIYVEYSNAIDSKVFEFLENNFAIELLHNDNITRKYYSKHKERYSVLFNKLENTRIFDDHIFCKFLLDSNKTDSFFIEKANFICERTIDYLERLNLTSDSKDILQYESYLYEYRKLAIAYKLKCANRYNQLKRVYEELVREYIRKHGQKTNIGPIDFKPVIDELVNNHDPYKYIQLTHVVKDGIICNSFDEIFDYKNESVLSEVFNELGNPRSDKYPYYKQYAMSNMIWVKSILLNHCIMDERLMPSFFNYIFHVSKQVERDYFSNSIEITTELCGTLEMIKNIILLQDDAAKYLKQAMTNGCCCNMCGTIEKILRNSALLEVGEYEYFDQDSNTLASLLKHDYKKISNGTLYYLEFYLSKENDNSISKEDRPGRDIRNMHMHDYDDKYLKSDIYECFTIFIILLSLLTDLLFLGRKVD